MTDERCKEKTERLNCGCCDDVTFECQMMKGHPGEWHQDKHYQYLIRWKVDKK